MTCVGTLPPMVYPVSIPAQNPFHTARVLAQLWHGQVLSFPAHPGSYAVVADPSGYSTIDIYPLGPELTPGFRRAQATVAHNVCTSLFPATHAAIAVAVDQAQIEAIGESQGWRVTRCNWGPFEMVEFWVENTWMLELLCPAIAPQFLSWMSPQRVSQLLITASAPLAMSA